MRLRKHKYNAKKTVIDGITFASKKEATRYAQLCLLMKAKEIIDLKLQPAFPMEINGVKVCTYKADFQYMERDAKGYWQIVVEDVKGMRTPVYKLKAKLFKALYPQMIFREV